MSNTDAKLRQIDARLTSLKNLRWTAWNNNDSYEVEALTERIDKLLEERCTYTRKVAA